MTVDLYAVTSNKAHSFISGGCGHLLDWYYLVYDPDYIPKFANIYSNLDCR